MAFHSGLVAWDGINYKKINKMERKQPEIEKGKTFTGWATFNWGICHNQVFRTRKEAMASLIQNTPEATKWDDIKDHFRVIKVKCTVL